MKIAFFLNTPAQVHLYKNVIKEFNTRGHEVIIMARRYGDTTTLLDEMGNKYFEYGRAPGSRIGKIVALPINVARSYEYLKSKSPTVIVDAGLFGALTSRILRVPCIVFTDSEPTPIQLLMLMPLVDRIITPSSFRINLGPKHVRVRSYKELAYLHPDFFKPNPATLQEVGIRSNERFALLRFNALDAVHDFGVKGFTLNEKRQLLNELSKYVRVFVSSESPLPDDLARHELRIAKHKIHDMIFYAALVVADTQTVVTEAAILGTPAIRCNSFVGADDMGNFVELERDYGLVLNFQDPQSAIKKACELAQDPESKRLWRIKAESMLLSKVNLVRFMSDFLETIGNEKKAPLNTR